MKKSYLGFGNLTADSYYHAYIRSVPIRTAVVVTAIAIYYSGGTVLIPLFA